MRTVLLIAGLDPSGGAGLLADARVAAEHGVRAVGVITAHTVQDTLGVRSVTPLPAEAVGDALRALLADVAVDAVKIGMLGDGALAGELVRALAATAAPIVWDPIIRPSRGGVRLLSGDARAVASTLLPEVRVVTPNLAEAAELTGMPVTDLAGMRAAAAALCDMGAPAALVKGGHLDGDEAIDVLLDGGQEVDLVGPRHRQGPLHGTGCVLSTALACGLAHQLPLDVAAKAAKRYLGSKLSAPLTVGRGAQVLV